MTNLAYPVSPEVSEGRSGKERRMQQQANADAEARRELERRAGELADARTAAEGRLAAAEAEGRADEAQGLRREVEGIDERIDELLVEYVG